MQGTDMAQVISRAIPKEAPPSFGRPLRKYFQFDEDWINLNHGSHHPTLLY